MPIEKKMPNRLDELKENLHIARKCRLYCQKCADKYGTVNEDAYRYWAIVMPKDIKLMYSWVVNSHVPITYCVHCGYDKARITGISPLDLKYKKQKEKKELSRRDKERIQRNLEEYASIFGKQSLLEDFMQPFWPDGVPNKDYAHLHPEQRSTLYTQKELVDMGFIGEISLKEEI
jgi:Zn ribbon nucleic-acid-binding protein